MLSEEQIKQIKAQLLKQTENLPPEQQSQVRAEIEAMNSEQVEQFLKQSQNSSQNSPFRQIVDGKVPSYKIGENSNAIAVLEINPISKGHTIILEKNPSNQQSEKTQELITSIGTLLKQKLNPKTILVKLQDVFGETITNLIPVYQDETLDSPRSSAKKEDLEKLQKEILTPPKESSPPPKPKKPKKLPLSKLPKAPKRRA
jgi:hypothetical protein